MKLNAIKKMIGNEVDVVIFCCDNYSKTTGKETTTSESTFYHF
jgi:hypothetical protein